MIKKVAIQGVKGSFHHLVTQNYFAAAVEIEPFLTFKEAVNALTEKKVEAVVMALENSIAGSIIPNYALIDNNALHITGEYYLDVQHNLMALPGQSIANIKEVCSHPMALLQCQAFFDQYSHF